MIKTIKTPQEIELMRRSGSILSAIIAKMKDLVRPGMMTKELDTLTRELIAQHKDTKSAFLGYGDFPAVACVSVNEQLVHGLPSDRVMNEGDIVSIDMGVIYKKWYSDSAITIPVLDHGLCSANHETCVPYQKWKQQYPDRAKLINITEQSMYAGIKQAVIGNHIGDISNAVQTVVEGAGFGVVRELVGHGIGKGLHEEPHVPNFGKPSDGLELVEGMVIAIEPMVTIGDWHVKLQDDKFTYNAKDNSLSAHFEHTVAITKDGPEILTVAKS